MNTDYTQNDLRRAEETVSNPVTGMESKYLAICRIREIVRNNPALVGIYTVDTLSALTLSPKISAMRQAFFLFREATGALMEIYHRCPQQSASDSALPTVFHLLEKTTGNAHRALAESACDLPLEFRGPDVSFSPGSSLPLVRFEEIRKIGGLCEGKKGRFAGRSFVCEPDENNRVLVIKFARKNENVHNLEAEAGWMQFLKPYEDCRDLSFRVPEVVRINNHPVFRLKGELPRCPHELHPDRIAMAYMADADYFCYPNDAENNMGIGIKRFERAMAINARQLGSLSARGIVHTAPIPLFHNRIQHARRDDLGFYEWFRGGRLDRWLFSCDHPNMGVSGLRDFEHFISFSGSNRRMYRWIGTHLLSLLLVIGSYFRNLDRRRLGRDREGNPADARDLFDETAMARMITMVFNEYYRGFTQYDRLREKPLDITALCRRMVEEMGVDRYMEEVLRVQDQLEMSDEGFCRLLVAGGWRRDRIRNVKKGEREITLMTGPHLGGFNDRISLPEMIEAVETMSAMCLYGRYTRLYGNRI